MDELSDLTNASFRPGTDATIDWGQLDKPPSSDDVAKAREWLDGPGFIPLELSGAARAAWHLLRGICAICRQWTRASSRLESVTATAVAAHPYRRNRRTGCEQVITARQPSMPS